MGTVVFISHPLGDRNDDPVRWHDNLGNASEWVRFFIDTTSWVVLCPWFIYAVAHNDAMSGGRRLVDSLTALERCDVAVMVGGVISPHMRDYESKTARRLGIPIVDLTGFGVTPPDRHDENTVQAILARVGKSIVSKPRRVWMPLLTENDLDHLKAARHVLYAHIVPNAPGQYDIAITLLDRIISAASDRGA